MSTNKAITLSVAVAALIAFDAAQVVSAGDVYVQQVNPIIVSSAAPRVHFDKLNSYDKNCDGEAEAVSDGDLFLMPGECGIMGVGAQNTGNAPAYNVRINIPVPPNATVIGVMGDVPEVLHPGQTATMIYNIKMQ